MTFFIALFSIHSFSTSSKEDEVTFTKKGSARLAALQDTIEERFRDATLWYHGTQTIVVIGTCLHCISIT